MRSSGDLFPLLLATLLVTACDGDSPADPDPGDDDDDPPLNEVFDLEPVATGLSAPIFVTAPEGDDRLFIVEQAGRILILDGGDVLPVPFLDIRDQVSSGGERGLFSLAFHPEYTQNGFFYVDYTDDDGDTRVERYQVSGDPDVADEASATLILEVDQPFSNHNGGQVEFGPDGMLYIALGDGGSGGDPLGNGQDRDTLLGSLLRIDVNGGNPYAIPPDNPFIGIQDARPEIWAYGLRNPWRFAFDPVEDRLYIADVGQSSREEVNAVPAGDAGLNYGWNVMEGSICFGGGGCNMLGLTLPVLDYTHSDGCSVTGGLVYRGTEIPELIGHYLYSDFCSSFVRSFLLEDAVATQEREWEVGNLPAVVSFGRDGAGEIYLVVVGGNGIGQVLRFVDAE